MLRPLIQRRVLLPGGRVENVGFAGLGDGSPGEVGPARVKRVSTPKGLLSPMHGGDRPYGSMGWGPPIKYVKIPGGEWGTVATLKVMKGLVLGQWGHRNPEVILLAKKIVAGVSPGPSKNYEAMAGAILSFMKGHVDYELDPSGLEYVQTPHYTLLVSGSGDCFVKGTKVLLREGHRLVPIETLRVGDEVWGLDRWSRVENTWDRGVRETWRVDLNNGCSMRLTPEHKVYRSKCDSATCGGPDAPHDFRRACRIERVLVSDLRPGDVVTKPAEGAVAAKRIVADGALRVLGVSSDAQSFPCFDVATDDHKVWLPEADWTTSQCDDQATATCALAMALGFRAAFRTVKGDRDRPDQWSHVYPVIGIQSGKDDVWLTADSTQKESYLGWDPPESKLFGMKTWVIDPQTQEAPVWL